MSVGRTTMDLILWVHAKGPHMYLDGVYMYHVYKNKGLLGGIVRPHIEGDKTILGPPYGLRPVRMRAF